MHGDLRNKYFALLMKTIIYNATLQRKVSKNCLSLLFQPSPCAIICRVADSSMIPLRNPAARRENISSIEIFFVFPDEEGGWFWEPAIRTPSK